MTDAVTLPSDPSLRDPRNELFGHPKGVYVCFFTEIWERFSFYGMKALLLLYLMQHHGFGDRAGLDILGAYGGLVYCLPVIGGVLADRYLGMRRAVIFGGLLLCAGHLGMTIEGEPAQMVNGVLVQDQPALWSLYFSLALIIMGVGFLKPNISTIVGKLYAEGDPRRDSGFSLFYAGINLGALFASVVCGYLGQTLGWSWGFGAAGIGMLLGLAQFLWGQRYLHGLAEAPDPARLRERFAGLPREWLIYVLAIVGLLPVAWLMHAVTAIKLTPDMVTTLFVVAVVSLSAIGWSMWQSSRRGEESSPFASWLPSMGIFALLAAALVWASDRSGVLQFFIDETTIALAMMLLVFLLVAFWYVGFVTRGCTRVQAQRMSAMMVLIFAALVFFTLYEQTYGSWVTFTDRLLTKDIVPSLVQEQAMPDWSGGFLSDLVAFMKSAPWSTVSLLLAPLAFVISAQRSEINPDSALPKWLFGGALAVILVFMLRDMLVLPQTAGSLTYLGALFIVLLAPIFGALWAWLDRRGMDPSKPVKSAFGLIVAGLAFIPLAIASESAGTSGQLASVWWLVLAYFVLEIGEMCVSPVGLSAVTQLAVPRVVSLMMGTWFLATAFSEILAALLGKLAALDVADGATLDMAEGGAKYAHLFWLLTALGIGFGVAFLIASPWLKRMMNGVK
ncbi:MAG: oligopeptide:H+ symporter [Lysobacteraceae bacterium]